MTEEQYSAEKDLLRLIENPGKIEPKLAGAGRSPAGATEKIRLFLSRKPKSAAPSGPVDLRAILTDRKQILRLLSIVTVCIFVYFVGTVAYEFIRLHRGGGFSFGTGAIKPAAGGAAGGAEVEGPALPDLPILRNIFKATPKKVEEAVSLAANTLGDYRLVGISQGTDPKDTYAMIKNAKTNITFFLKQGEQLDGMQLLSILENKLILKVRGQDVELR